MQISADAGTILDSRYIDLLAALSEFVASLTVTPGIVQSGSGVALLDEEMANIANLFDVLLAAPEVPYRALQQMYMSLASYLSLRGYYDEKLNWGRALLTWFADASEPLPASLINSMANAYDDLGQFDDALRLYNFLVTSYVNEPQHPALAVVYSNMARAYERMGKPQTALVYLERAIMIAKQAGDARNLATALMALADILRDAGRFHDGLTFARLALDQSRAAGDAYLIAQHTSDVARHMTENCPLVEIVPIYEEALRLLIATGDEIGLAKTLFNYALLLGQLGEITRSYELGRASLAIYTRYGSPLADHVRQVMASWPDG